MSQRKKDIIWVAILSTACGLVIWHVVCWHSQGMYLEMFQWLREGRGYLTVLYNLALISAMGLLVGLLMARVTRLLGYSPSQTEPPGEERNQQ